MNVYKGKLNKSSEGGYTILEGIMAIVVVSVMMVAIGPVIALSVGTRMQAKRMDLATQAASSYIEAIRSGTITNEDDSFPDITTTKINSADAPTSIDDLYCIDSDGDGNAKNVDSPLNMCVQGVGYHPTVDSPPENGYILGVRVYRANSFRDGVGALEIEPPANTSVTNALGDPTRPMLVMTTEIIPDGVNYNSINQMLENKTN